MGIPNQRMMEDIRLMHSTMEWPHWPLLPIKRHIKNGESSNQELAILIDVPGHNTTAFYVNLFGISGRLKDLIEDKNIKRIVYADFKDIVENGWMVD